MCYHGCSYGSHLKGGGGRGRWEVGRRRSQKRRGLWDKAIRVYSMVSLLSRQIMFHFFPSPSFLLHFQSFSLWALKFAQGPPLLEDHPITLLQAPAQLCTLFIFSPNKFHLPFAHILPQPGLLPPPFPQGVSWCWKG